MPAMTAASRGSPRGMVFVALASYALAFSVRLAWIFHVQSPFDAVSSDMAGYVDRAERLLWHLPSGDPRLLTLYPPGHHMILAAEFYLLGRHARTAISVAHALVGAVPAAFAPPLAYRLARSPWLAAAAGIAVALWEPQVCFVGFFMTEIWFSALIAAHAWLTSRDARCPFEPFATGLVSIAAIVVRPQFLLTWALETGARSALLSWRRGLRVGSRAAVWLAIPVVLGLAATSVRYHGLAGHWGLVSTSAINRIWADTDVCELQANWVAPNGDAINFWFNPPSKPPQKPSDTVRFSGYIADPDILEALHRERTRGLTLSDRVRRKLHNVQLLLVDNLPWPESEHPGDRVFFGPTAHRGPGITRMRLQEIFRDVLRIAVLPWAVVGLALARPGAAKRVMAENLLTPVVAAAFFFGEARYHVPYDPFLIVLALAGAYETVQRMPAIFRRSG